MADLQGKGRFYGDGGNRTRAAFPPSSEPENTADAGRSFVDRTRSDLELLADALTLPSEGVKCCDGCGDVNPEHWREGGWYCHGCASCEVCQSPYCDNPEHEA